MKSVSRPEPHDVRGGRIRTLHVVSFSFSEYLALRMLCLCHQLELYPSPFPGTHVPLMQPDMTSERTAHFVYRYMCGDCTAERDTRERSLSSFHTVCVCVCVFRRPHGTTMCIFTRPEAHHPTKKTPSQVIDLRWSRSLRTGRRHLFYEHPAA